MNTIKKSILLVDDNISIYKSLYPLLEEKGFGLLYASNTVEAKLQYEKSTISLTLLDIRLGDENGLEVLKELLSIDSDIPVIMITGFGTIDTAVEAMERGASHYIQKPINFQKLFEVINSRCNFEESNISEDIFTEEPFASANSLVKLIIEKSTIFANSDLPILIQGESGTGKEVLADFIHNNSMRGGKDAVKINCSSFNESILDNELFGHEKGAYTGANSTFKGVFERAHNSTLFLDEIGDMPLPLQAKILRAIQNKEIRRLGGTANILINVRFIAATNKDLKEMICNKLFREDLYYRLNTATLQLPPLRERIEDIEDLSNMFIRRKGMKKKLSNEVILLFKTFSWPGNIRELENVINYALVVAQNSEIQIQDLPQYIHLNDATIQLNIMQQNEKETIMKALEVTNRHKTSTAELLGISRKTLYNKIISYEIDV